MIRGKWAALLLLSVTLFGAAKDSPGYATYERANTLFVEKNFPGALAAAEEALRLDPKLVPALTLKAKLALAAHGLDAATRCLEQALAIDPHAPYAQFLYGLAAYMGNDMKAALPRFRKARQLSPTDPRAVLYLALTVESLGQPVEAMALYEDAVRLESSAHALHAETLLPGAKLLHLLGRLAECERWIMQAAELSPNSRDVHFEFARLLLDKGDDEKAVLEADLALRLSEGTVGDSPIHYLLVRAYQRRGMPDRAAIHAEIMRIQESTSGGRVKN